jgi:hypothetical protein
MAEESKRARAERLAALAAEIQEAGMKLLLQKIKDGVALSADLKLAMDTADKSGLVLNPDAFPQSLKDKLTSTVDPKKFQAGDADVIDITKRAGKDG